MLKLISQRSYVTRSNQTSLVLRPRFKQTAFHSKVGQLDSIVAVGPVFEKEANDWKWTHADWLTNEEKQLIIDVWKLSGKKEKKLESLLQFFPNGLKSHSNIKRVAVVQVPKLEENNEDELQIPDNVRKAAAIGVKMLRSNGAKSIGVESFGDLKAAAEGAYLGSYKYDQLKTEKDDQNSIEIFPFFKDEQTDLANEWERGKKIAYAQNWARVLAETPSNLMTPTKFSNEVIDQFSKLEKDTQIQIEIKVHDKEWAESHKMGCFLGVSKGSNEPLKFVEIHYNNTSVAPDTQPLVFVGKGITFDSGGISIKPSAGMGDMKGDMSGAASVAATMLGIASLKLPIKAIALIPLCENMPSGTATKPGDVLTSMSGKTVEVDNTDAEGRLILADALSYAHTFNPHTIIDVATLTGAMGIAVGNVAFGVFSSTKELWKELYQASVLSGERCWRMPLFPEYKKQIKSNVADLKNTGGRGGGACTAAMFLKEFVKAKRWSHLDIAPVMNTEGSEYNPKGMSGIPVKTLVNYASKFNAKS